ncbi:hypothetical protein BD311DRAFT_720521 [Dichomitus squalens]|uniref:DUF6533 domain-containing protein n=1 Tax=Dichomitus squalens TaxID=114155 RepID=A0A4V2K0L7_9APHY|nr:hypothetical protein BD311DRAFT_720521 [Dichomitus squalens]
MDKEFPALIAYEYVATFASEVTFFWIPHQVNGVLVLFLLNRYLTMTTQIMAWAPLPSSFQVRCFLGHIVSQYDAFYFTQSVQYLPWAAFSTFRSYALCPEPYRLFISATVLSLAAFPGILNLVTTLRFVSYVRDPVYGALPVHELSESMNKRLTIISRSLLIGADLLVLCVTWYRTYETVKFSRRDHAGTSGRTFSGTLLRDGTAYFLTLLVLNCLHVAFTLASVTPSEQDSDPASLMPLFSEPITAVLTSRFLINLQEVKHKLAGSSRSLSGGELEFQHNASGNSDGFIGSFGRELSFGEDNVGDEDVAEEAPVT